MTPEAFWSRVDRTGECWLWTGVRLGREGYGVFVEGKRPKRRNVYAHRRAFELAKGPVPDGMMVLHSCGNRPCVNPSHLYAGTHADNMRDMVSHGRSTRGRFVSRRMMGESNGAAKLTAEAVVEIRAALRSRQHTQDDLAARFGVTQAAIFRAASGLTWLSVPGALSADERAAIGSASKSRATARWHADRKRQRIVVQPRSVPS